MVSRARFDLDLLMLSWEAMTLGSFARLAFVEKSGWGFCSTWGLCSWWLAEGASLKTRLGVVPKDLARRHDPLEPQGPPPGARWV